MINYYLVLNDSGVECCANVSHDGFVEQKRLARQFTPPVCQVYA